LARIAYGVWPNQNFADNCDGQVCWALDYLHTMQHIHGDLKPSNIFLMSNRRSVRLGDFGISKILDSVLESNQLLALRMEGRAGTKRYMAPEVLTGKLISCRSDIWSVGCVIFELSTLKHPTYEQTGRFCFEWIQSVYSRNLLEIISSCLCQDFDDRPSPMELMDRLIAPYRESASVQQIFHEAIRWQQQQLEKQMVAFQDQIVGLHKYLPSGSVSDGSYPSNSQVRPIQVEEQSELEKGRLNGSGCDCQSKVVVLRRDHRSLSTDRRKSFLGVKSLASRSASDPTCKIMEMLSYNQALSSPAPCLSSVTAACPGHSFKQDWIVKAVKQCPSLNRLVKVELAEDCCSAASHQQLNGSQQQHEEQACHLLATSLGRGKFLQEVRSFGCAHLSFQSDSCSSLELQDDSGLDLLDKARPLVHVAPGQHCHCQKTICDGGSAESCTCHFWHPMETRLVVGMPSSDSASVSAGCLWDIYADVKCSDQTQIVAQLASAAGCADIILFERLKPYIVGEEAKEQICSDYDIMCHQVDARHSGCCPPYSCFISNETALSAISYCQSLRLSTV
jgi:serine/threonine protein kinase